MPDQSRPELPLKKKETAIRTSAPIVAIKIATKT
jgi:hypothetical protein